MTRITNRRTFDAPADVVWDVVTDPDVYESVAPNLSSVEILEGAGTGMVRRCVDTDGNAWTESCTRWEDGRLFAVSVETETSDFHRHLFHRFEGEWRLTEVADGVQITMTYDFETKYGPFGWLLATYFQYKAPGIVEPIFDGWAAEIDRRVCGTGGDEGVSGSGTDEATNRLYR